MTETTESLDNAATTAPAKGRARKGEGLSGMVLTDLKALAGQLGIRGTSGMRKGDLVAAIAARQNGAGAASGAATTGASGKTERREVAAASANGHGADPTLPLGDVSGGDRDNNGGNGARQDTRQEHTDAQVTERSGDARSDNSDRPAGRETNRTDDAGADGAAGRAPQSDDRQSDDRQPDNRQSDNRQSDNRHPGPPAC